jgi:HTH-type transcriptional regulator/antitoxin HigA
MSIKPIKTRTDYEKALLRLEKIFDAKPNTAAGMEANMLAKMTDEYENIHYPIEPPNTTEAIKIRTKEIIMLK